jgi:RES domain-containing protein
MGVIRCYRIVKRDYALPLSGKGAAAYGGRWNSRGTEVIYTAEHRSLALLELLVHVSWQCVPKNLVMLTIRFPDDAPMLIIDQEALPADWQSPAYQKTTRQWGDRLIADNKHLVMRVPSAILPEEYGYVINPTHRLFSAVEIISLDPFQPDNRLMI